MATATLPVQSPPTRRSRRLGVEKVTESVTGEVKLRIYKGNIEPLSRRRAVLSKGNFLTQMARDLGLDVCLRLNKSEEDAGGPSVVCV